MEKRSGTSLWVFVEAALRLVSVVSPVRLGRLGGLGLEGHQENQAWVGPWKGLLGALWGHLGAHWGPKWFLGLPWGALGVPVGTLRVSLGGALGAFESPLGALGGPWGSLEGPLGLPRGPLGGLEAPWAHIGAQRVSKGPPWGVPFSCFLEANTLRTLMFRELGPFGEAHRSFAFPVRCCCFSQHEFRKTLR